ncbi:hypothetical protein EGW08_019786 [Elysia chlorotica]|uniref:G-protein coupled receptors family 1 profile domain-containing protein n=1 Tax=Elysia chlorotica TaxID=188477 RepID=A0A433ST50_ELYCH|nr:hypothetical protein EGW08_019786 [Elysia chlorotica]
MRIHWVENQSPTLQNDVGSKPIPQQKHKGPYRTAPRDRRGPEAINTVWEDEGNAEDGWHCAVGDAADFNVDSVSPTHRFQGRNPHLFMRQESLNNYYQSATNTPNESLDGLSEDGGQNGDEEEKEEDQALAHESSTSMCRSWDAFNSIEGGDSNPTLNNSGSLEAIKPLAGNLQKKPKASGFEIAVTSVEFHLGANGDRNNSVLSFGHSCSAIDSTDSSSKAAHWGSQSALNAGSVSIDKYGDRESFSISNYSRAEISKPDEDREAGGVGKRGKWCKQETHAAKLGHRPDCTRLCVSDYLTLSESEAGRCCVCRDCSSLPSFTEELHRQKLCPLTMKRAFSAPSLPSLPEINTCNYQCRQKYAVRTANPDRHCEDEVRRRYTEICPSPYKHLDVNTNSLSLQRTPLPSQTKTGEGTQFRQSLSEDADKAESSVDIKRHYKKLAVFLPTEADIRLCNYDGSQPSRHLNTLSTNRLTNTMLGVTLGSVVSFLPHLFVQIFRGLRPDTVEYLLESSSTYFVIHHLCMRSFFANNALNPVIYSFTNDTFNKKGKSLLRSWAFAVLNKFGCGDCVYLEQDFNSSHMDETG